MEWMVQWTIAVFLPSIRIEILIPQCDGVRRWGLWDMICHQGGALMNGISSLIKKNETTEYSLALSLF